MRKKRSFINAENGNYQGILEKSERFYLNWSTTIVLAFVVKTAIGGFYIGWDYSAGICACPPIAYYHLELQMPANMKI